MAASPALTTEEYKAICKQLKESARKWVQLTQEIGSNYQTLKTIAEVDDDQKAKDIGFPNRDGYLVFKDTIAVFDGDIVEMSATQTLNLMRSISTAKPT